MEFLKGTRIFLSQNDKSHVTNINFAPNTPSTANTAKFDCLDLSGPPCRLSEKARRIRSNNNSNNNNDNNNFKILEISRLRKQ